MSRQNRNVDTAVAKRRQRDTDRVDTIVEITSKRSVRNPLREILIARGHHAEIGSHLLRPPHAVERSKLERSKQLSLHLRIERPDLIHENRAAIRELKQPQLARRRFRVSAALVSEELTLDERIRNRRAIDVDERARHPMREPVQHARDQLLPRPRLAKDEDSGVAARNALDQRKHRLHWRELCDDFRLRLGQRQPLVKQRVFAGELALFIGASHHHIDLRHAVGLREVIVRAELHGADRRLDGAVAGNDDDLGRRELLADLPEHLETIHLGHHDVQQRHIERLGPQRVERGAAIGEDRHLIAASLEKLLENRAQVRLVFCDQHLDAIIISHEAGSASGSITRTVLPFPTVLSTSMRPP